jgi:LmbE family N-acetylglucosaminyl deacetylase
MKQCVMAVGAHADDHEMRCAGTLAKYRAMGYGICYVVTTNNTAAGMTGADATAAQTYATRRREAAGSAALLGTEPVFLDYAEEQYQYKLAGQPDPFVYLDFTAHDLDGYPAELRRRPPLLCAVDMEECVEEMAGLLVRHEPEIIFTHSASEQNAEHWATAILVLKAFRRAKERVRLGHLLTWYWDDTVNLLYTDGFFADISAYQEQKLAMLRKHASQGFDRPDNPVTARDRLCGAMFGVQAAERFRVLDTGSPV